MGDDKAKLAAQDAAWRNLYERYRHMASPSMSIKTLFNLDFKQFKAFWGAFAELVRHARDKFVTPIILDMVDICPDPTDQECKHSPHGMHEMYHSDQDMMQKKSLCIYCGYSLLSTEKSQNEIEEIFLLPFETRKNYKPKGE